LGFIFGRAECAERLDWRGFCEVGSGFWGGKNASWGLDKRFLGRKQQKKKATAKTKAINQSLRPSGFAPAFGRAEPTHHAKSRAMNGAPGRAEGAFGEACFGTPEGVASGFAVSLG
jgi:hypothetical protein